MPNLPEPAGVQGQQRRPGLHLSTASCARWTVAGDVVSSWPAGTGRGLAQARVASCMDVQQIPFGFGLEAECSGPPCSCTSTLQTLVAAPLEIKHACTWRNDVPARRAFAQQPLKLWQGLLPKTLAQK